MFHLKNKKFDKIVKAAFFTILALGLALRFYQYLMGRSLWEDECHFALNFIKYGYLRLTKPLDDIQAGPIFFLFSVKTFAKIFGYVENALRAPTFIWSVLTLPLFYFIILDLTKSKITALLGFFVFSVNLAVIYFSSELKPYGIDVGVYLLMVYLVVGQNKFLEKNRRVALAVAGCTAILFSNTAFIILFCIACYLLLNSYKEKKIHKGDIKVLISWACVFIVNYFMFIYKHPSNKTQQINYAFAFCPINIFSPEFTSFIKKTIEETFFTMLLYISKCCGFAYILLLIFIVAIAHLIVNKKYTILLFTCLPIFLHLVLSALKIYPFWFRLILYLVPCFITLMALGTYLIGDFLSRKLHFTVGISWVLLCCVFFVKDSIGKFPLWPREIKPALNFVNRYPANTHVYITDPVNAYKYYYYQEYVKDSIYEEVPWNITPKEYYEMVADEKSNYLLFYGLVYQWGYGSVIEDLKKKGLVVKNFEYNGYAVSEVKPSDKRDTVVKSIFTYFNPKLIVEDAEGVKAIPIWSSNVVSKLVYLEKGNYNIVISSKGTPVDGIFPHNNLFINETKIGEFTSPGQYQKSFFTFRLAQDTSIIIKINMDNDAAKNNEDRNTFIRAVNIVKSNNQ